MLVLFASLLFSYLILCLAIKTKILLSKKNIKFNDFTFEDLIVTELSSLALILIGFKLFKLTPDLRSLLLGIIGLTIATFFLLLIILKFNRQQERALSFYLPSLVLPKSSHIFYFAILFIGYLIRALVKAKKFNEIVYIPSRYNTDIFLYLRRISVFLGNNTAINHLYDGVSAIDILYDSPKLLSSLVYAIFIDTFQNIGVAGTILTSLLLSAIALKYLLLIQRKNSLPKLFYIALVIFLFFQSSLSWLQDQFYLSNLLYVYLLIYTVEYLLVAKKTERKIIFKFAISAIAVAGFYPSQLPFLALATIVFIFLTNNQLSQKLTHIAQIVATYITISLVFISQYTGTTEVTQHFNLADSKHGVNLIYIPFWSILNLVPKPGGFKIDLGSIALVILSILLAVLATKYLSKKYPTISAYLYLSSFLYLVYSLSFLIFPGSYRQGKFFVTYIIPLVLFCFFKIIQESKIKQKSLGMLAMIFLATFVTWNSLDRKYKSHITIEVRDRIEYLKSQKKAVAFYYNEIDRKHYYLSYQLRDSSLQMISHCPTIQELEIDRKSERINIISSSCNIDELNLKNNNILKLNL